MATLIATPGSYANGFIAYRQTNQSFGTIQSAATGTTTTSGAGMGVFLQSAGGADQWNEIRRTFLLFDTSSLSVNAVISSATLMLNISGKSDVFSQSIDVVASTPASTAALADADYDQVGTTLLATSLTIASITSGATNSWTLNASGISAIVKGGVTELGLRVSSDTANSAPTWSSNTSASITWDTPTLTINYVLPGGFIPLI